MASRFNINREWKFARGEFAGAISADFDDSNWSPIGLPHSFDLPYFRTAEFYVGVGWYRKKLQIPEQLKGKKLFLEFEGAFQVTDVFVNGQKVGRHEGGYTPFVVEISDAVRVDQENQIAIRVDNNWNPRIAPRAGEHFFSGGIYRDVYLLAKEPVYFAWHGNWVTTPNVSENSASVHCKSEIINTFDEPIELALIAHIRNSSGQVISQANSTCRVGANASAEMEFDFPEIANPKLWHPDVPNLYRVELELTVDGAIVDRDSVPLGFRWFSWTKDGGFFLNGQPFYLNGANVHQDHAGWGIAITQAAIWRDVMLMKECGFNFIRGAHYPHHRAMAQACDTLGMIFWSENCFWGKGGFGPEGYWNASAFPTVAEDVDPFSQSCKRTLEEMIRTQRNHPSIVVWSMTNEAFFTFNLDHARELMGDLVAHARKIDPTRLAAIGGAQRGKIDHLGDVAGYNGDGARLFIDPGVPNMVSEYGAISKPLDVYDPFWGELQTERFAWRGGQAIWCGFDYGTIAGKQGLKGIVRHDRIPKRSWYWYRNEYREIAPPDWPTDKPATQLRLSSEKNVISGTDATDDCQIIVTLHDADGNRVNQNPPVTLTIESGPGEFPTGRSITFSENSDVMIAQGEAAIAMRSYFAGTTVVRATSLGIADATIEIKTIGGPVFEPGVSPIAPDRPYVAPPPSQASIEAMKNAVNVARDRPSSASSELSDHPARLANDADSSTHWIANSRAAGEWVLLDLEGFYQLSDCRLEFAQAGNFRYTVETSIDKSKWKLEIDRSGSVRTDPKRHDVFDAGTVARFVRLTFVHVPPGQSANLAEIAIHGVISLR